MIKNYFINKEVLLEEKEFYRRESMQKRNNRDFLSLYLKTLGFESGDVLLCSYRKGALVYTFEGICISIRGKNFVNPNVSLLLRNVIAGVGIECMVSYYYNRIFSLKILDYRRKRYIYRRNKLFYLRQLVNQATKVS